MAWKDDASRLDAQLHSTVLATGKVRRECVLEEKGYVSRGQTVVTLLFFLP